MAYYLSRYVGTYRVKAEIDKNTNDYPRDIKGFLEQNDTYIACKKGQITHYGRNILECYVPKLGTGRNILKALGKELNVDIENYTFTKETKDGKMYTDKEGNPLKFYDYDSFYDALEKQGTIINITETSEEVIWKFKSKDIELMAKYMQPKTSGANISPFSTKNLFKDKDYKIPLNELEEYKKITNKVDKDILILSHLTKNFIANIPKKNKLFKRKDIKVMKKKSGLKGKEFIHSIGLWNEYLKYLNENIK